MVESIGAALRAARQRKGLSLRGVAASIDVSASLLSQVETGKTQPSVSTLYALVSYLGISLDELFGVDVQEQSAPPTPAPAPAAPEPAPRSRAPQPEKRTRQSVLQRAGEHPVLEMENGVRWELLAVGDRAVVDPLLVTYLPGASSSMEGRLMRHSGMEYGYLLQGELTLQLEFDTHLLRAGDSLCFDSTQPHLYVNRGTETVVGVWFVIGRRGLDHTRDRVASLLGDALLPSTGRSPMSAVEVLEAMDDMPPGRKSTW